jgi:hypothetical protein
MGEAELVAVIAPGLLVIVYVMADTVPEDGVNEKLAPVSLTLNNVIFDGVDASVVILTVPVDVVVLTPVLATTVNV